MTINDDSTEEEQREGMIVRTMISFPESFWVTWMNPKDNLLSPNAIYLLFYDVDVALDLAWEGELFEMEYEDKLQPLSK